jgi:hypothetical protein
VSDLVAACCDDWASWLHAFRADIAVPRDRRLPRGRAIGRHSVVSVGASHAEGCASRSVTPQTPLPYNLDPVAQRTDA